MTNIVAFPKRPSVASAPVVAPVKAATVDHAMVRKVGGAVFEFFMVMLAAFWPIVRWILSFDVFFRFLSMMWHWDTPGSHAGWTFLLHMSVATTLFYLMATHKLKS